MSLNNIMTAGRMNCLATCPRQHFWRYEVGLQRDGVGLALRVGTGWANGMEVRWNGGSFSEALAATIPEDIQVDAYTAEMMAALLACYYELHGNAESEGRLKPEVKLPEYQIEGTEFRAGGVMDALGTLADGRDCIIESKTTSSSLSPRSDYWIRLAFNFQVLQYISESRRMGWDVSVAYYDVTKKPALKPKDEVQEYDEDGLPIILDRDGNRAMKFVGKKGEKKEVPKLSANKANGEVIKCHKETPEEYGQRLYNDIKSRPDFYFCRKEIPVLDDQIEKFERCRYEMVKLIEHFRSQELSIKFFNTRDPEAWPTYVREQNCNHCQFKSFCLQGQTIDIEHPPEGFSIQPFNPELDRRQIEDDTAETTTE